MRATGWLLTLAGLALMAYAFAFNVGIDTNINPLADYAIPPSTVANIDLLGQRQLLSATGGFLFVAGVVAIVGSYLEAALLALKPAKAPPASPDI